MSHERHSTSTSLSTEENMFIDTLHEAPLSSHRQPTNIFGSILYCFILTGYAAMAAAAPWIFLPVSTLIPALLCSCNALLIIITGVFQQYWVYQVRKVRLQGYYVFSQKLKHIARLPFASIAYGTALMLLAMAWHPHIHFLSLSTLLRYLAAPILISAHGTLAY